MGRIALLSDVLINKIAAGEVVERPASVVKELVENAVDAEARHVHIRLREGGLSYIEVSDDGIGMSQEDAVLSLSRHATSKLRDTEGLFHILTKGFRGEALPAIASVSRLTLTTTERGASMGTRLVVEGGKHVALEEVAPAGGTIISVEDLFYSVPARRKFMRREQTELGHCEEALVRIALAHPEVGFYLEHEGRDVLKTSPCAESPKERIAAVLGKEAYAYLVPVDERWLGIRVHGFIATSEYTLPTARGLYCFVNHRYVRDRGLISAVQRGYLDSLPPGRQPVVVLFIEVDPSVVDVNVHPQKLEVRFSDAKGVYDSVYSAVSSAIRKHLQETGAAPLEAAGDLRQAHYAQAVERFLQKAQTGIHSVPMSLAASEPQSSIWATPLGEKIGYGQALPDINDAAPPQFFAHLQYIGTLGQRFWVCEGTGGTLVVVCPHAALERMYLEELCQSAQDNETTQGKLFQSTFELPQALASQLSQKIETLARLGLVIEPFGGNSFVVSSAPSWLLQADFGTLSMRLLEALDTKEEFSQQAVMAVLACEGATLNTARKQFTHEERQKVMTSLDQAHFDVRSRHGRIVVSQTPFLDLIKRADSVY